MSNYQVIQSLTRLGFSHNDATALRRISMTLHRWHELECGVSNDYVSWTIARGRKASKKDGGAFTHDDNGKPFLERHIHTENFARYESIPDRERGALKRLKAIMGRYPTFGFYVQGDPRGASLYILRPGDVPEGATVDSCYSRGVAVYK